MPDNPKKGPGRVVGRSKTHVGPSGKTLTLTSPMDRAYLCQKLCFCNAGTRIRNSLGHELKQRCTTASIWADEEINQLVWRYKAEVGYNMAANPPAPLMSIDQPNRPSRFPLGRAIGDGLLKRDLEGRPLKGLLRIPDCIILNSTGIELAAMRASGHINWDILIPVKRNIETVLEIKFAGDTLGLRQRNDYRRIAGKDRFRLLEIKDCDCGLKRPVPASAPVRVPVTTPMRHDSVEKRPWYRHSTPPSPPAPAPSPQLPQYGPSAAPGQGTTLVATLKAYPVATEIVLIGAIALLIWATKGVGLVVIGGAAAASNSKKKEGKK